MMASESLHHTERVVREPYSTVAQLNLGIGSDANPATERRLQGYFFFSRARMIPEIVLLDCHVDYNGPVTYREELKDYITTKK
jgi:hypothetical protein